MVFVGKLFEQAKDVYKRQDQKLLYESRREQSIAGRKATLLQFNSNLHYALTVSIGRSPKDEDCAEFTICNLRGEIISENKMYQAFTISESFSESDMLKGLIAALRAFIAEQSSSTQAALCAIAVSYTHLLWLPDSGCLC